MYRGFDDWYNLHKRFIRADFTKPNVRKAFRREFEKISIEMFKEAKFSPEELAQVWFDDDNSFSDESNDNQLGAWYYRAWNYVFYASDRMCLNRWMYIRWILNKDVK